MVMHPTPGKQTSSARHTANLAQPLTLRISSMLMGAGMTGSAAAAAAGCCLAGPPLLAAAAARLAVGGCAAACCRRSLSSPAEPSSDPLPSRRLRC